MSRLWRATARGFGGAAVLWTAAVAADLEPRADRDDPFAPTRPVGVASELPRSPLADIAVFGTERFATAADAQARCPRDVVVRVETLSRPYRAANSPGRGLFMCKSSALSEGDLPR